MYAKVCKIDVQESDSLLKAESLQTHHSDTHQQRNLEMCNGQTFIIHQLYLYFYTTTGSLLLRPIGVIPFEFRRELWCQKMRVTGLSCGIICMILRLAVFIQYRNVTHTQTEGRTDTRRRHVPHLA